MKKIIALVLLTFTLTSFAEKKVAPAKMYDWSEIQAIWQRIESKANQALHSIMAAVKGHHQDKQTVVMHEQTIKSLQDTAARKDLEKDSPAMKDIERANKSVRDAKEKVESVDSTVRDQLKGAHDKIKGKRKVAQKAVDESTKKIKKATEAVNKA